jgi:signal transduction histidine kinase
MVQETFSNITRHAQASQASLTVHFAHEVIMIEVTDNGKGFVVPKSPAEFAPSGHYGLLGLYERAELIGAALEIRSASGQGTHVNISLPLTLSAGPKDTK